MARRVNASMEKLATVSTPLDRLHAGVKMIDLKKLSRL